VTLMEEELLIGNGERGVVVFVRDVYSDLR
jgi:hypothetical protein